MWWGLPHPGTVNPKKDITPQTGEVVSSAFESIDGDEIFYKFNLTDEGFRRVADMAGWPVQMEEGEQTK